MFDEPADLNAEFSTAHFAFSSTISTRKTDMKYKERIEMFTAYF